MLLLFRHCEEAHCAAFSGAARRGYPDPNLHVNAGESGFRVTPIWIALNLNATVKDSLPLSRERACPERAALRRRGSWGWGPFAACPTP